MISRLIKHLKWSALREVGNSFPSKLALVFPAIGYLILFNTYVVGFLRNFFTEDGVKGINLVPWSIYFYFYGLFLVGIGSVLYVVFCPGIIKQFQSHIAYIKERAEDLSTDEIVEICDHLAARKKEGRNQFLYIKTLSLSTGRNTSGNVRTVLYNFYQEKDLQSPYLRLACFACYSLGTMAIIVPSVMFAVKVTASLL